MNRATIIGRITKDIELRYTSNAVAFTSIQVAINNGKDKEGKEETDNKEDDNQQSE